MDELLGNVSELIRLGKGDSSRLEHIKESIKNGKQLYSSDRNYLDGLIQKHLSNNENLTKLPAESKETKNMSISNNTDRIKDTTLFCKNCGKSMSNEHAYCPFCGDSQKRIDTSPKMINQKQRVEKSLVSTSLKIIGVMVILFGIVIVVTALEMPAIIAGQYIILGLIVSMIGGIIIYGAKRIVPKKESHFICGYCGYAAATERELYNHSLSCEKAKDNGSRHA